MTDQQDTSLRVQDLTFAYWREPVLRGVSFELQKGAVGLLGPNGSGKTTLLRALLGQVPLVAGPGARPGLGHGRRRAGCARGPGLDARARRDHPRHSAASRLVAYMGELARHARVAMPCSVRTRCCTSSAWATSATAPARTTARACGSA